MNFIALFYCAIFITNPYWLVMAKQSNFSSDDVKRAQAYARALKNAEKRMDALSRGAEDVNRTFLGLSRSMFFEQIPKTTEDFAQLNDYVSALQLQVQSLGNNIENSFRGIADSMQVVPDSWEGLQELIGSISDDLAVKLHGALINSGKEGENLVDIIGEFGNEAIEAIKNMDLESNVVDQLEKSVDQFKLMQGEIKSIEKELEETHKEVLNVEKGLTKWTQQFSDNYFSAKKILGAMIDFDDTIKKSQRETGIRFSENSIQMALLTSETAKFGMSVGETAELMGALGRELRTADFGLLAEAAGNLAAMQKATGMSVDEVAKLSREFMFFGQSSEDVAEFSAEVMNQAYNFGVNGRKVMGDIAKNMDNMRKLGFTTGEKSLAKMVITAERLGMEVDEIFDVAKKARSIEGAMDMASQLILAGGSFSQISPLDLLAASRRGPQELQKILTRMGSDIGSWNEETGKYEFSVIDVDRLSIAADATGMSLDSLQKMIAKNADDARKLDLAGSYLNVAALDDEQKAFLSDMVKVGEGGKLEVTGEFDQISSLEDLTQENIKAAMTEAAENRKNLEEQATQNMSFRESQKALMESIVNLFSTLEPAIKFATDIINQINKSGPVLKLVFAGFVGALALAFGPINAFKNGFAFGKGHTAALTGGRGFLGSLKESFTGLFKGKKGAMGMPAGVPTAAGTAPDISKLKPPTKTGPGMWLTSLAKGLDMFTPKALKGAAILSLSSLMIGGALVAIGAGIAAFGGDASGGQLLTFGAALVGLSTSLLLMSKIMGSVSPKDILIGSLALTAIGAGLLTFGMAVEKFAGVNWETLGIIGASMLGVMGAMTGIGALMMSPAGIAFVVGAGALAVAGASMALFGASMLVAASGFNAMSAVNWEGFGAMGGALLSVIPGLLGFAAAGLALFLNPLLGLGMITMIGTLSALALVMSSLAPSLDVGSKAMMTMAEGIDKMKIALEGLSTEKLEKLEEISDNMSSGVVLAGFANMFTKLLGGGAGGGTGGGGTAKKELVIDLKLNGRQVQEIVIDDTKFLS